jgi:hypothetical protein
MIKIGIALSLVLPLISPTLMPDFGPRSGYCAALGRQQTAKLPGEIFEDDSHLVFNSPLSKNLHYPIDTAAAGTGFYRFDSQPQRTLKKALPLFNLKCAFLI